TVSSNVTLFEHASSTNIVGVSNLNTNESGQSIQSATATSNSPSVVAHPTVTGTGSSRMLLLTPGQPGSSVITVTVQDDGGTANGGQDTTTQSFMVTVEDVNDPPVFNAIANQSRLEDQGSFSVTVTGLDAIEPTNSIASVVATSSDPSMVPHPTVSGSGSTRSLTISPNAN
ncbi:MAG: hypothetical protein KDB90_18830, partial [Planctomycetes bacterium]|nr:hypothetical protein [Planctomycetota bacterium]